MNYAMLCYVNYIHDVMLRLRVIIKISDTVVNDVAMSLLMFIAVI